MVDHVPERLLRAVVKVRTRHQHVPQVRRLERGSIAVLLRDEKPPERRHVRLDGRAIDSGRVARSDELFGRDGQRNNIVPDDADADVVKVVVHEVRDVSLGVRQRMAFITEGLRVEQFPTALGGVIDGVLVAGDEVIERRIERNQRPLVRGDGTQQIRAVHGTAEDF